MLQIHIADVIAVLNTMIPQLVIIGVVLVVTNILLVPMYSMVNMAMGGGKISEESSEQAKELCTQIAEEGIVLLKNDSAALPLAAGTKVNVFGWSSTNPIYGGTGSGALSAPCLPSAP